MKGLHTVSFELNDDQLFQLLTFTMGITGRIPLGGTSTDPFIQTIFLLESAGKEAAPGEMVAAAEDVAASVKSSIDNSPVERALFAGGAIGLFDKINEDLNNDLDDSFFEKP